MQELEKTVKRGEAKFLCPMSGFKSLCRGEKCAWWVEEAKTCAILVIAKELYRQRRLY